MSKKKMPLTENDNGNASKTICWLCANAVPRKDRSGRYIRGCHWSIYKQKVDGWVADEYTMKIKDPRKNVREVVSFEVHECPEFVRG